jgi:adenylate cyclase
VVGQLKGLYLGFLVTLVGLILSWAPYGLDVEERYGLAWLFWARGPKGAPSEVVIIAVDRRSAKKSGWPEKPYQWPRTLHAQLI